VFPLSVALNRTAALPAVSFAHTVFLIVRTQVWTELFDIDHDRAGGRRTTVVVLGRDNARALLTAVLVAECAFVRANLANAVLQAFSAGSLLQCAVEFYVGPRLLRARAPAAALAAAEGEDGNEAASVKRAASRRLMVLTLCVLGSSGYALLLYVWNSGVLAGTRA
jgi:4-hydroxybenzoate polyprenyltransferase